MLTLFLRAIILYILVFVVIRLMGKRQISELQPFDLVFTLLIADLASNPIGDTGIPLVYGIIPILALFLMQQSISYLSLKSERARTIFAGKPQILIARGVLREDVMRKSSYSINDLMEQLRAKDVFDISDVSYAIIETNGTLSVMLRGNKQRPDMSDFALQPHNDDLAEVVVCDGIIHEDALALKGHDKDWLNRQLRLMGFKSPRDIFFAMLSPNGDLYAQACARRGGLVRVLQTSKKKAGAKNG
ncbi:MAG: DUF421 domain-containing protein [Clostridiales bacterium]|nr:DUF421 domain-containing protein [Clostridiales bacterium]